MDQNLKGGTLTAGALVVPGLNLSIAFQPVPIAKANEWVGTPTAGAATTLASMVQNGVYYTPIVIPDVATLISIGVNCTVAAGGTAGTYNRIRLGVFKDKGAGNNEPGDLLLGDLDVDVSATHTGFNPVTIALTLDAAGLHWLGAVWQTDYTTPTAPTVSAIANGVIQLPTSSATPATSNVVGYLQTGVTGSLANAAAARTGVASCPRVMVKHQ